MYKNWNTAESCLILPMLYFVASWFVCLKEYRKQTDCRFLNLADFAQKCLASLKRASVVKHLVDLLCQFI